jgi:allophanate hydrolase subunit 1
MVMRLQDQPSTKTDNLVDCFPSPRYFQVHFQHIHENNLQLRNELAQLKDSVAQTDKKIERFLALLSPADPVH